VADALNYTATGWLCLDGLAVKLTLQSAQCLINQQKELFSRSQRTCALARVPKGHPEVGERTQAVGVSRARFLSPSIVFQFDVSVFCIDRLDRGHAFCLPCFMQRDGAIGYTTCKPGSAFMAKQYAKHHVAVIT